MPNIRTSNATTPVTSAFFRKLWNSTSKRKTSNIFAIYENDESIVNVAPGFVTVFHHLFCSWLGYIYTSFRATSATSGAAYTVVRLLFAHATVTVVVCSTSWTSVQASWLFKFFNWIFLNKYQVEYDVFIYIFSGLSNNWNNIKVALRNCSAWRTVEFLRISIKLVSRFPCLKSINWSHLLMS